MESAPGPVTEDAVRRYLLFLDDPRQLRDDQEIQKLTQVVLDAVDPIEKLKALSNLERASSIDEAPLRQAFVEHAKAWADAEQVSVDAFRELRVPDDVLREARFDVPSSPARPRRRSVPVTDGGGRADPVAAHTIQQFVLQQQGTFVLADILNGAGGSPATVRKAVEELVDTGRVERLGPVADHGGRGRAPIQYRRR